MWFIKNQWFLAAALLSAVNTMPAQAQNSNMIGMRFNLVNCDAQVWASGAPVAQKHPRRAARRPRVARSAGARIMHSMGTHSNSTSRNINSNSNSYSR